MEPYNLNPVLIIDCSQTVGSASLSGPRYRSFSPKPRPFLTPPCNRRGFFMSGLMFRMNGTPRAQDAHDCRDAGGRAPRVGALRRRRSSCRGAVPLRLALCVWMNGTPRAQGQGESGNRSRKWPGPRARLQGQGEAGNRPRGWPGPCRRYESMDGLGRAKQEARAESTTKSRRP